MLGYKKTQKVRIEKSPSNLFSLIESMRFPITSLVRLFMTFGT